MDPGVSLFSGGADQFQLNGNPENQREEEEEALEDQRRRDQELKKLFENAFDDLAEEEDEDDQSVVSGSHLNGFPVHSHSNNGSGSSNHHSSPHYYYDQIQSHSIASAGPVNQFENGVHRSPLSSESHRGDSSSPSFTRYGVAPVSHAQIATNGFAKRDEMDSIKYNTANQNEADHFGYLSSIPQGDISGNGHLYASDMGRFNGSHPDEDLYRLTDVNSQDHLMVLYTARTQEVSRLSNELAALRHERDCEVEQFKRKLLLLEAEKQGAFLSHKEAQSLLSDYQTQISKLHQDVEDLRLKNITLEKSKDEVTRELEITKASAVDLQQKVSMLERKGSGLQSEKHVESFLKTVQKQHDTQTREMQSQIESLTQKFSQKDHECCVLERKLRDAQRSQEVLIVEKGEVITELNKQLEEAQRKVRDLASSMDNQETIRVKLQLEQVLADRNSLEEKLREACKKLEIAESDLKQYETVSKMGLLNNGDSSFETDSITHLGISRRHSLGGRTEKVVDSSKDSTRRSSKSQRDRDDLNNQLRDELQRALQGQKSKREEIRRLQGELAAKDQKIKTMKEQEKVYFVEAEKFKKNLTAVLERLKRQEEEAKALQGKTEDFNAVQGQVSKFKREKEAVEKELRNIKAQLEQMKSENDNLQEQLADMELQLEQAKVRQVDQTAAEFLAFHDESLARLRHETSRQLEAQVVDYRVRMEQAQKECEEIKRLYVEVCSAKRALLTDLKEEQAQVRKLTSDLEDMKEAQQSLEELHKQERELNRRLRDDLDKGKSKAMETLQEKESQIEERIGSQMAAVRKELENKMLALQRERDEALAQVNSLQKQVTTLEQDSQQLKKLEAECSKLRNQAIEAPRRQQAEVERISLELEKSKERVQQLEKRLRAEFQSQMDVMIAERDKIQAQLRQKDIQLEEYLQALSRIKPPTREIAVNTENGNIEALRKEFDQKILQLNALFKAQEEEKIQALQAEHKAALASAEDQMKEETVKCFAEEISRLEEKHRCELGSFAKKLVEMENAFARHLATLKSELQTKTREVEDLNLQLRNLQQDKGSINGKVESGDSAELRLYVEHLKDQTESDRNKMAEALAKWAEEIKGLQSRESLLQTKLEEMKTKYRHARKAALHYKKTSELKEAHMINEWNRLESGYREALNRVQARVVDIVGGQEQEVTEQLKRIESCYEGQIKDLASKLKQQTVIS